MHYTTLNEVLKAQYGGKVYRLALSSGCSCPNRDGTLGHGGCIFCSEGGSGDFAQHGDIEAQLDAAKALIDNKFPRSLRPEARRYIAYFQSFTNTYGDTARLESLFRRVLSRPEIVILSIATRPDCLAPDMVACLARMQADFQKPVWVELGLQSIHAETARWIQRGYELPVFEDAYQRLSKHGLAVIVHLILGFPNESREQMLESVRYLSTLTPTPAGVKLQLLHVLRGTALGALYEKQPFPLPSLEAYAELIADCLKLLPEGCVVHRLTGDAPKRLLLAPLWSADKKRVLNTLTRYIREH